MKKCVSIILEELNIFFQFVGFIKKEKNALACFLLRIIDKTTTHMQQQEQRL